MANDYQLDKYVDFSGHDFHGVFGVHPIKPLRGFPDGKIRLRLRNTANAVAFVRPRDGGVRRFVISEFEGEWWPGIEQGANRTVGKG